MESSPMNPSTEKFDTEELSGFPAHAIVGGEVVGRTASCRPKVALGSLWSEGRRESCGTENSSAALDTVFVHFTRHLTDS